ncbi:MAG: M15 family metallopeptidase [Hallerella porci]|uniref:LAS superfamily LD-carboxypeptidase LdcB n=1 Tax=Hallerella porci TaxID=1945871 RepID=A0ABX5LPW7_9BACT|nr:MULTISPECIES: M15 family metallopeptidase [Hallerella]MCI5600059.1 M15 family metallopeptidase [Hallerella sp.]MDY3920847.1 M15 family metallopeptidase [Hallerella porci]PWL04007.1 LAS superfamily LD-carboxypeptidase LdcB [Hallerella porci]
MTTLSAFGLDENGLVSIPETEYRVCQSVLEPLEKLTAVAKSAGFSLRIESAYRSFERQLSIWNRKATGKLTLRDAQGVPFPELPQDEEILMRAILFWSALPGTSRHHFGTDLDVVDGNSVPAGYEVELTEEECDGMFAPFHRWLSSQIDEKKSFGFTRVFVPGCGKIQPERWHISHRPSARELEKCFDEKALRAVYEKADICLKSAILDNFDELMRDYVYPYFEK